ncbi:DUF3139 domain-containing protein [Vagococcus hydrophili]|uniref:DUF3139 domain-containing protein n=1 Tax=Vagococcus hydrophili TaxID=2714947 RepID=A0A6G8AS81_9ENTE|nr:DUF3139 domain-containing protein [Vagococcus hydrophili]QIL47924.1 DUF3139 domain-containing protein [Vagococcus hydrophili]
MNKKLIVVTVIIIFIFSAYIIVKKRYEYELKNALYAHALSIGISEDKIRKTELNYFAKFNGYEYSVYLKDMDDDLYFNIYYSLPFSPIKTYLTGLIESKEFDDGVYTEGSIEGIESENGRSLLKKAK